MGAGGKVSCAAPGGAFCGRTATAVPPLTMGQHSCAGALSAIDAGHRQQGRVCTAARSLAPSRMW